MTSGISTLLSHVGAACVAARTLSAVQNLTLDIVEVFVSVLHC